MQAIDYNKRCAAAKDIKIRCILVILISDKTLGTTKPGILSINDRLAEA